MAKIDLERERQRLRELYSAMNDLELQKAGQEPAALTEVAFAALQWEMARRGLEWAGKDIAWAAIPAKMKTESDDPENAPEVVRKYRDMPEAVAARMTLESAGIECYLYDESVVRMDWLWSNALGGMKLVVRKKDADEARKILDQPARESFDVEGIGEYEQPRCPACGSLDVSCDELRKSVAGASLMLGVPIAMTADGWHCRSCGHRWGREKDGLPQKEE